MTSSPSRPMLATTLSDVLGNLAFMSISDDPRDESAITAAEWIEAGISYRGPFAGAITLRCTQDFAYELAGNLLSVSPDDPEAQPKSIDAVKELLNIVCGRFITNVYGVEPVFDLTPPTARRLPTRPDLNEGDDHSASVYVEGWPVQILFREGA